MARISLKDAARLGIRVPGVEPSGPSKTGKQSPARRAPGVAKAHKTGRAARHVPGEDFRIVVSAPLEPVTKARARTQIDIRSIVAAFVEARGSLERFKTLLSSVKHRSYTPENTAAYENVLARVGAAAMRGRPPLEGPLDLIVAFTLTGDPETWPTAHSDPDLDNAEKAALDALNGVVWKDDRQIVAKRAIKRCGVTPSVTLVVSPARPDLDIDLGLSPPLAGPLRPVEATPLSIDA